jgi:shikimate kinase
MGAGKTTHGKRLAGLLNHEFIDLDDFIEKNLNKRIPEIFHEDGEDYFRQKEAFFLRGLEKKENLVLAVGGGTPCYHSNMEWMNQNGRTVYLKLEPEAILSRLWYSKTERPLITGKSKDEVKDYIEKTLDLREQYYLKAKDIIDGRSLNTKDLKKYLFPEL